MENKQLNLSEPENIMGTMDVNPLLIKLSIPMMISMLVQALYNVVDAHQAPICLQQVHRDVHPRPFLCL